MILVDSSIWVDHLRNGIDELRGLLHDGDVLCHDFVLGELACGSLRNRGEILRLLRTLPQSAHATTDEVLTLAARESLWGAGIGWVDVHLLAAARLSNARLWTRDKKLRQAAKRLDLHR